MRTLSGMNDRFFTLDDILTPEECRALIARAEVVGFESAPITTRMGFVHAPEVRNNTRVMIDDPDLAGRLWARLRDHVPAEDGVWRALGLNERLRFYRYHPGQYFEWHHDGAFRRSRDERSLRTVMVYLNGGFSGGTTDFDLGRIHRVVPVEGRVLVFDHPVRHRGARVETDVKYVLRSDVMYRRAAA